MKHFKTIGEFHQFRGIAQPLHPLFSVIDVSQTMHLHPDEPMNLSFNFYSIAIKRVNNLKAKYGQLPFDHNNGLMSFMAPNQVISISRQHEGDIVLSGWVIYIHPDFLWNTALGSHIQQYDFWDYSFNEALFLSEKEEEIINNMISNILLEYENNIDKFSKKIILSHIESLLNYSERYYNRQFITREKNNHQVLQRLEALLQNYFDSDDLVTRGLPTVKYISDRLNLSPKYLSSLLKVLTGLNTQQHIHEKLIAKAKEKLSTTNLTISEIAYDLGFEHLQSFSKLFKTKTDMTPSDFRQLFN